MDTTGLLGYKTKNAIIADIIRDLIVKGSFKKGDKLLPDDVLAAKYQVDKRTVAAGLNTLVEEGLLERAPRRGTIVVKDMKEGKTVSNAVGMVMLSKGDVYGDLNLKISQGLMRSKLYPVLINESIVIDHWDCVGKYLDNMCVKGQRPYGLIVDGEYSFPYDYLESNPGRFENVVFIIKYHHPQRIGTAKYALVDFAEAGRQAAQYLIDRGHKKLACLAMDESTREPRYAGPWSSIQVMIMQGFAEACRDAKVAFDEQTFWKLLFGAPFKETVTAYMKGEDRPDAFFCYRDHFIRNDVLPILEELSLNYPEDIEFVGFYDTHHAEECGFSSFRIHGDKIADAALKLLTGETEEREIMIRPELVIRQKVAGAKE